MAQKQNIRARLKKPNKATYIYTRFWILIYLRNSLRVSDISIFMILDLD